MTYWNYRVIKTHHPYGEIIYCIHEVYYDEEGNITRWAQEPTVVIGHDDIENLSKTLELMKECVKKPILIFAGDKLIEDIK